MANKTYEIAFKLAGQMSGNFSTTFNTANKSVKSFSNSLNGINQQAAKIGNVVRLRKETGEAARAYAQAKIKVAELGKQISKTENPSKELTAEFQRAKNEVTKTKNALERKRQALKDVEEAAGTTGESLKDLINRQKELEKSADKARIAQEKMAKAQEKMSGITAAQDKMKGWSSSSAMALGKTAAIAAPVTLTVKAAMDFEDMQAELGKYSDNSAEIFAGITELTKKYSKSAVDMTAMATNAMQTGIAKTKEDVLTLVESQTQAAVAFGMTGDAVGSAWADIQSKMGMNVKETQAVFDIVNKLGNKTSASSEDILNVLQRQGGAVKGLTAMNEKQVAALAGAFRSASVSSETAATSMGTFVSRLTVGASATKKQEEAFEALGLNAVDVAKNMTKSAGSAETQIQDIFARISKLDKSEQGAVIGQLFGNEASIKSAVATLSANSNMLGDNLKMVGDKANYTGSMFKEYSARASTTSEAMGIFKNQIILIAAKIGQSLLPTVKSITQSIIAVASKVANFVEKNKTLIGTILKVAAGALACYAAFHVLRILFVGIVSPLLSVYKGIIFITSGLAKQKIMAFASSVATKAMAAAQWLLNTSIMGCPIVWIIAGIAALIAIGILLYKNWDVVKAKCVQLWAMFAAKFPNLAAIAKGAFNLVVTGAKWLWAGLKWAFSAIMSYLQVLWSFWKGVFNGIWNALKIWFNGVKIIFTNLLTIFDNIIGFVKNVFTGNWSAAWENVKNIFGAVWGSLVQVIKTPINAVIAVINGAISGINNALGKIKIPDWVPKWGGKSFSFSIPKIPQLADGGIATKATLAMIGEGNESEAVLPLSKLNTLLNGGGQKGNASGGNITVNYNPTINISGGGSDAYTSVKKGLRESEVDFRRMFEQMEKNKRRLSYV